MTVIDTENVEPVYRLMVEDEDAELAYGQHSGFADHVGAVDITELTDIYNFVLDNYEGAHRLDLESAPKPGAVEWSDNVMDFVRFDEDGWATRL